MKIYIALFLFFHFQQRVCNQKILKPHVGIGNVEDDKNLKMVEKYKAEGSGLFLTSVNGKTEKTTDFTNFAFSYSRNEAEKFIAGLKAEIEKNLK